MADDIPAVRRSHYVCQRRSVALDRTLISNSVAQYRITQ
ncbi:hypothetical protein I545_0460 [Mycobacterium kansasii 662]|uniref:Uncharacterized protein n=2 Tax=Mycobacterium kansasii TaxID=1768 RepID=A0A1V3XXR9_MYCKA|nr:hypothetical protein I547_0921 [Mycobacterium kansasii 824]EUA21531.1 hypothetical protein I545_0460 [Mycobacterium kansasii 662]KEP43611.1 hypothetical protein MKSMC1_13890 [Mycobacterium kansasii]OOK84049.1 hypothetical protein BZL29_0510 [Mycobacterium kansasii]